jgi:hypothetical protein
MSLGKTSVKPPKKCSIGHTSTAVTLHDKSVDQRLPDLISSHLELVLHVDVRGCQHHMDPRAPGVPDSLPGAIKVGKCCAAHATDHCIQQPPGTS